MTCPCGLGKPYSSCCEPYVLEETPAPTPEALMRSRYTAYTMKNMDYVEATTDPQTRQDFDRKSSLEWAEGSDFFQLEVLRSFDKANKGTVEFKAHFTIIGSDGPPQVHHELAKFRKQAGIWYFRDGKVFTVPT